MDAAIKEPLLANRPQDRRLVISLTVEEATRLRTMAEDMIQLGNDQIAAIYTLFGAGKDLAEPEFPALVGLRLLRLRYDIMIAGDLLKVMPK